MIDVPQRRAIVSHSLGDRRESILPSQCACSSLRFSPFSPSFSTQDVVKTDNVVHTNKREIKLLKCTCSLVQIFLQEAFGYVHALDILCLGVFGHTTRTHAHTFAGSVRAAELWRFSPPPSPQNTIPESWESLSSLCVRVCVRKGDLNIRAYILMHFISPWSTRAFDIFFVPLSLIPGRCYQHLQSARWTCHALKGLIDGLLRCVWRTQAPSSPYLSVTWSPI